MVKNIFEFDQNERYGDFIDATGNAAQIQLTTAGALPVDLTLTDPHIDIGDIHLLNLSDATINPATLESIEGILVALDNAVSPTRKPLTVDETTGNLQTDAVVTGTVDIGTMPDVNVASLPVGSEAMTGSTPITIATDDVHMGTVGAAADVDGVIHGQLRFIGDELDDIHDECIDILSSVQSIDDWEDSGNFANYSKSTIYGDNGAGSPVKMLMDASGNPQVDIVSATTLDITGTIVVSTLPDVTIATLPAIEIATAQAVLVENATAANLVATVTGTIDIATLPDVNVATLPSVEIATGQAVIVENSTAANLVATVTGTIDVATLPDVNIATLPSVEIATGQAVIVENSTAANLVATVTGTVDIATLPDVNIATMPDINIAASQTVGLDAGTASIGAVTVAEDATGDAQVLLVDATGYLQTIDMNAITYLSYTTDSVTVTGTVDLGTLPDVNISTLPDVNIATLPSINIAAAQTVGLDAGTASIGTVLLDRSISVTVAAGTGAVSLTTAIADKFRLSSVTIHTDTAMEASDNLVVSLDATDGTAYDAVLSTISLEGVTDAVYTPTNDLMFESGDEIKVSCDNVSGNAYGVRIVCELI